MRLITSNNQTKSVEQVFLDKFGLFTGAKIRWETRFNLRIENRFTPHAGGSRTSERLRISIPISFGFVNHQQIVRSAELTQGLMIRFLKRISFQFVTWPIQPSAYVLADWHERHHPEIKMSGFDQHHQ